MSNLVRMLNFTYSYLAVLANSKYIDKINANNKGVIFGLSVLNLEIIRKKKKTQ